MVTVARSLTGILGSAFLIVLLFPLLHGAQYMASHTSAGGVSPELSASLQHLDGAALVAYVAAG